MAKPIPWPAVTIAVLIPTTSPFALRSGPPEFPGLIDASVWMKSSPPSRSGSALRPVALTTPRVTVLSRPNGFPTAMANSPTLRREESPSVATGSFPGGWIRSTATSV